MIRGQIGYSKPGDKFGNSNGAEVIEQFIGFAPIEVISGCERRATFFSFVENEELFDNKDRAFLAHQRATGIKKLVTVEGIRKYRI